MLTEEEIAAYFRDGYLLRRGLVPAVEVAAVLDIARTTRTTDGGGWTPRIFDYEHPERDAGLHRFLRHPSIVGAAGQLLGGPARIYYGMLAIVPARGGNGLPWHQDNMYSHIYGGALNVFVALDDILLEQAGLWVAPGSHRFGVQPSRTNDTTAPGHREALTEPEGALPLPAMAPGDACIFTRDTLHRSGVNATDANRYAYAAQFCAAHARYTADGTLPFRCIDPMTLPR